MRKSTLILASAVLLSFMAVPAFAVDTSECDQFKKGGANFQPGLYGLCVAYQNADEDGKENIFANWQKKVGEDGLPQLPGYPYPDDEEDACPVDQDFCCPCWSDFTYAQLAGLSNRDAYLQFSDALVTGGVVFFEDFNELAFVTFSASSESCGIKFSDMLTNETLDEFYVVGEEYTGSQAPVDCVAEIEAIATEEF